MSDMSVFIKRSTCTNIYMHACYGSQTLESSLLVSFASDGNGERTSAGKGEDFVQT